MVNDQTYTTVEPPRAHSERAERRTPEAGFRGAIFDVDGVLVDSPHEEAWRETLRELMETDWSDIRAQTRWSFERFTPHLYQELISGKPRMSGARAALEYFGVPDLERRTEEYAERKQQKVVALIEAGQFTAYQDALRFLLAVKAAGIPISTASSSKNAGMLLSKIRLDTFVQENGLHYRFVRPGQTLLDLLDVDISGRSFKRGKPDPEIFLAAASELSAPPRACFVVEDAVSGITAAKAGEMAGLGISRADDFEALVKAGADLVVTSLDEVDRNCLLQGRLVAADRGGRTPSA